MSPSHTSTRRVVSVKMVKFAALSPGESNLMSFTPLKVVTLADNNHTNDSNSSSYDHKHPFSPSLPFVFLMLFAFFLFMCVFSIFSRRRSTNWDRTGERGRGHNMMEILNWEAARGLDRAIIESFPVFSYSLVKGLKSPAKCSDCAVCLADFQEDEMLRLLPHCSHAFHPECIDNWLFTHTSCPLCRTSLVLVDDSASTATDLGLVELQPTREEVTVVIDNGAEVRRRTDISNDGARNGAPGYELMDYSLVRVCKEMDQPTEWYIATAEGLMPGLRRNVCSFVGADHSHEPSGSNIPQACSNPGGFVGGAEHISRSERWGRMSLNPASVFRTFSERISTRPTVQVEVKLQDDKAYFKRTQERKRGDELAERIDVLQRF